MFVTIKTRQTDGSGSKYNRYHKVNLKHVTAFSFDSREAEVEVRTIDQTFYARFDSFADRDAFLGKLDEARPF